jgi:glycosyltransferase involved in cell wall biosynthesis
MHPSVSVVIPTYRHRDFVLGTLDSVFAQTYTNYEVIVVNDGSPDDTADVLRPLAEAGRIRYIEQPNAGQGAARNRGIAEARGEFIALLDDDDLWPPDKLAWQVRELVADQNAVMVYGYAQVFGDAETYRVPSGPGPSGDVLPQFFTQLWLRSPGQSLMRAESIRRVNGFDETIWGADDWDLYLRLAKTGPFIFRDHCALRYRSHPGNASQNSLRMYRNAMAVHRKHLGVIPRPDNLRRWFACRRFLKAVTSASLMAEGLLARNEGDWTKARRMWLQALRIQPSRARHPRLLWNLLKSVVPIHRERGRAPNDSSGLTV